MKREYSGIYFDTFDVLLTTGSLNNVVGEYSGIYFDTFDTRFSFQIARSIGSNNCFSINFVFQLKKFVINIIYLNLAGANIKNFNSFPKLENLKNLNLCKTDIESLEGIEEKFPNLEYVDVRKVPKNKLKPLLKLEKLNEI